MSKYVAIGVETTFGTAVAAATYENIRTESMEAKIEYSRHGGAGYAVETEMVPGKEYSGGDITWPVTPDGIIHHVLYNIFGSYTGTGTKTYVDGADTEVSHTIRTGRKDGEHIWPGQCLDRLELASRAGEYLVASISATGAKEDTVAELADPSFPAISALHMSDMALTYGGVVISGSLTDITLAANQNHDTEEYGAGGTELQGRPQPQRLGFTGTINLRAFDTAVKAHLLSGGSFAVDAKWTDSDGNYLQIELHNCHAAKETAGINERNIERYQMDFEGVLSPTDGKASTWKLHLA